MSSTDSGESGDDNGSDFELSDRDTQHDYEGYEKPDSDSDISTEAEEEEEEEELRGRRHVRAKSRRSGRRVFGGRRGRRRRGLGRASTSRSRSPIDGGEGEGDDDGWVEDNSPYYSPIYSDAWADLSCANDAIWFLPTFCTTGSFAFFVVEETNDYAYFQREEMRKKCAYVWSGVGVEDIAHYLGIVMWVGIIGLPEIRMYWAHNMTFSLSAFPQTKARRSFEAIQKYFHSFNRRAIPKGQSGQINDYKASIGFYYRKMSFPLRAHQ